MNIFESITQQIEEFHLEKKEEIKESENFFILFEESEKEYKELRAEYNKGYLDLIKNIPIENVYEEESLKIKEEFIKNYQSKELKFKVKREKLLNEFVKKYKENIVYNNIYKKLEIVSVHKTSNYDELFFHYQLSYEKKTKESNFTISFSYDKNNKSYIKNAIISVSDINRNYLIMDVELSNKTKITQLRIPHLNIRMKNSKKDSPNKKFMSFINDIGILELDKQEVEDMFNLMFDSKIGLKESGLYKTLKEGLIEINTVSENKLKKINKP